MGETDLVFVVAGAAALLAAALPGLIARLPVSLPVLFLASGVVLYLLPLPLPSPDPVEQRAATEHLTELCLIVSLMGAGLALNRPFGRRGWSSTARLLVVVLPVTTLAMAGAAQWMLGWPLAAALLLGAVLAPTDPVLASDVQVGEPVGPDDEYDDEEHDDDEVRFSLTSEAGLNDGLAFPLVLLAVALAGAGGRPGEWLGTWLAVDLLYKCAAGLVVGLLVGWLLGRMFFRAQRTSLRLAERNEGFVALAATLLAYGVAEAAGGYGFIAVFTTACAIRAAERTHGYHGVLHGFIEQIERLLTAWLLLLLGGYVATGGLADLTWQGAALGLLLLLVVRPLVGWLSLHRGLAGPRERRTIAFFGVRGIGSLFYLAYALGHADFGVSARSLWAVVTFTVLVSVCLHGLTSTPVLAWLDHLRKVRATAPGR
ncbi:cation:proton antiporter [Actinomadura namibiensis]|uniref:NhaP-type Na+/H+ or K+/H+ antiporter n=1 Tax=Actinomadura namibiensis TaxID=182080 RepID=A0A7W3QMS7_ACTNM|nr:cation:proton antiporter [Actinomadura namibiensis]MBA8952870.1 NhaP-type Na+/H+ or K+/H+ antiporter [Actinomadura namibiensis]